MSKQMNASIAMLIAAVAMVAACGGSEDAATSASDLTADQQARVRAIKRAAGEHSLVCRTRDSPAEALTLAIDAAGDVRLGNREPLKASDRDAAVLVTYGPQETDGAVLSLNLVVPRDASSTSSRSTDLSIRFDAPDSGPLMLAGVQFERGDQADWADCVPAANRSGLHHPIHAVMAPLLGHASESLMCTVQGTNIPARHQLDLSETSLSIVGASSRIFVDLHQARKLEDVMYPNQSYAVTPANTGQRHQAKLADGSWFAITRDRSGTVTEASAGSGRAGESSLTCRR